MSCSWTPTLAHRCQSSASRSSSTLGVSPSCAALQPPRDLLEILAAGQRRNRVERGPHVAKRAVGGFERQVRPGDQRLDAAEQVVQPGQRLAARALLRLAGFGEPRAALGLLLLVLFDLARPLRRELLPPALGFLGARSRSLPCSARRRSSASGSSPAGQLIAAARMSSTASEAFQTHSYPPPAVTRGGRHGRLGLRARRLLACGALLCLSQDAARALGRPPCSGRGTPPARARRDPR